VASLPKSKTPFRTKVGRKRRPSVQLLVPQRHLTKIKASTATLWTLQKTTSCPTAIKFWTLGRQKHLGRVRKGIAPRPARVTATRTDRATRPPPSSTKRPSNRSRPSSQRTSVSHARRLNRPRPMISQSRPSSTVALNRNRTSPTTTWPSSSPANSSDQRLVLRCRILVDACEVHELPYVATLLEEYSRVVREQRR
jgi:hypothetical protein